jgi:hypothetical protein
LSWDPATWKRSRKILLGIATIWPPIYMVVFMVTIFSVISFFAWRSQTFSGKSANIDLIQLEQKIKNGELSQLKVRPDEIIARDLACECEYHASVSNRTTQVEIIRMARELGQNGAPRVSQIDVETEQPPLPAGFPIGMVAFFAVHMLTMFLMMALLPLYIIIAVKNEQFDQTTRIVWIILICLMAMFTMPVYWYLYVWKKRPVLPPPNPNAPASAVDIPSVS